MRVHLVGTIILLLLSFSSSTVIADTIDLNDFYADPSVNVAGDGTSATMSEDPSLITVYLSDDPSLGDPILPFPSDPFFLSFSYEFTVAAGNWDDFYVKLFDANTGTVIENFLIEYNNSVSSTDWTKSDTINWNITGAPSTGLGLGLEFQLNAYDDVSGSTVQISNVEFNLKPVPEPATIFIFGLGLVGLSFAGRKNIFGLN